MKGILLHTVPRARVKREKRALAGRQAPRRMNQKMRKKMKMRKRKMRNKWLSCNDVCGVCVCAQAIVLLRILIQVQLIISFSIKTVQIFV